MATTYIGSPITPAIQRAVLRDRVMAGGDRVAVERVGVMQQIAELGERIASDAGDGRSPARILGNEIVDDIVAEAVLEVQHVMRNPELVRDELGIGDRVEGTARAVGHAVAVAEQLQRRADDVVPLLHKQRRRDGAVHPARHCDEHSHRCSTADNDLTSPTIRGSASATASTSSMVLSLPNEKRSAAMPSSRGTSIAVST